MFVCFIDPCAVRPILVSAYDTGLMDAEFGADFFSSSRLLIEDNICRTLASSAVALVSSCALAPLMSTTSKAGAL